MNLELRGDSNWSMDARARARTETQVTHPGPEARRHADTLLSLSLGRTLHSRMEPPFLTASGAMSLASCAPTLWPTRPLGCRRISAVSPVPHLQTTLFPEAMGSLHRPALCSPALLLHFTHPQTPQLASAGTWSETLLSLTELSCLCNPVTVACPLTGVHERAATSGWLTPASRHNLGHPVNIR